MTDIWDKVYVEDNSFLEMNQVILPKCVMTNLLNLITSRVYWN